MKKSITLLALACIGYVPYAGAQVIFSEDFESTTGTALPGGWTQTNVGTTTWKTGTNTTLQSNDFPVEAHTRMVGFNDDGAGVNGENPNQLLKTPTINLSTSTNPYLSFDMYYFAGTYQDTSEMFTLEVSTNGGTNWTVVQTIAGNTVSNWETRYVPLTAYAGMSNVMIGFRYGDNNGWLFGAMLDNITVFTPAPNDAGLTGVTPAPGSPTGYGLTSGTIPVGGTVFNYGATAITSFTVNYSVNGGAPVATPISSVNVAPFTSYTFTATPANLPANAGIYSLDMWITLTGDANAANDSMASSVGAAVFMPNKKLVFEEGTGTWCGWCPRGAAFMDTIHEMHGDQVSLIAVHNGTSDPMRNFNQNTKDYDNKVSANISGYPSVWVDRRGETDPSTLINVYNAQNNYFGFAEVTIGNVTVNSNDEITVPVTVKPAIPLSGDYRLALVLTEDGVTGTGTGWAQTNYYSSNQIDLWQDGFNWKTLGNSVTTVPFDFVARYISNVNGNPGSLPASMTENTDYTYTFSNVAINSAWSQNSLKAVVMMIRNSDGVILNSDNKWSPTGVANVTNTISGVKLYPNPTTDRSILAFTLKTGGKGTVQVTDALGRIVFSNSQEFGAGEQFLTISTADFAAGIYNVKVETTEGSVSERLTVVK